MRWPERPLIYEINTWVWLQELSRKHGMRLTLANVPGEVWDSIADLHFDAVWLMGVWERSPAGIAIANANASLLEAFREALSDYREDDNVGSAYCVRRYVVDEHLGGNEALARARAELAARGLRLLLDFVPNHVAPDHPWVAERPDYFVQGDVDDTANNPDGFVNIGGSVLARGRDPHFPPWPDVLQLNAFDSGLRQAAIATLSDIAIRCDGVRCDMAMLLISSIFGRTWGRRAGPAPETEYWSDVISALKKAHPEFLFIAEAYWDLEWQLQQQGFDYCYDKRLYDRLAHDDAESLRLHLLADLTYQERSLRFTENHDEPRALTAFLPAKARAAVVSVATLPGAKLFHEGQIEGRSIRIPVFLRRRPAEPADPDLGAFYRTLLETASSELLRRGQWRLCDATGWPDNATCRNLVVWCWRSGSERCVVAVNLSESQSQGLVLLPWNDLRGETWRMTDLFTSSDYDRDGDELAMRGLYLDLPPWGYHLLRLTK
jgi:hypothetical protein